MDRAIIYPGQVPLETDLLKTNQNVMVGLAKLSQAIFGTSSIAVGFGTTQTVVPSLAVLVAAGEIYSQQNLEASAFSSLPQDLAHSIVKQGILLDGVTLPVTPPGTAGFSVNYLVQVGYQDTDSGSAALPYYNASNPSIAYSRPANSGAAQPTVRQGSAFVSLKAGTAATTGTQTTPSPDAGKIGLFVVTVANGASSVLNANITAYPSAPLLSSPVVNGRLLNVQTFSGPGTFTYNPTPGTRFVRVRVQGGGGAGGGVLPNTGSQCSAGEGGGSGSYAEAIFLSAFSGVTVTVGAVALGQAGSNGLNGNASSFGALVTAPGGPGGAGGAGARTATFPISFSSGLQAVNASGGNLFVSQGSQGGPLQLLALAQGVSGQGGNSVVGGGGAMKSLAGGSLVGQAAAGFGAGGGGATGAASLATNLAGGNGAQGIVIVEEYA